MLLFDKSILIHSCNDVELQVNKKKIYINLFKILLTAEYNLSSQNVSKDMSFSYILWSLLAQYSSSSNFFLRQILSSISLLFDAHERAH